MNNFQIAKEHDYFIQYMLNNLSYDGIIIPSNNLRQMILGVERLFKKLTNKSISKTPNVNQDL